MRWSEVAPRSWRLELDVAGVVRADPEALRNALDALLENAVKYTEPHAGIALRASAVGGEIVIEVADEGAGVPAAALHTIFDRFARADDARTRVHGGVGLGLAIVAAIAKAHGGTCTVERRGTRRCSLCGCRSSSTGTTSRPQSCWMLWTLRPGSRLPERG